MLVRNFGESSEKRCYSCPHWQCKTLSGDHLLGDLREINYIYL